MRFAGFACGILAVALSSPGRAQTTYPTETISLSEGTSSTLTYGPVTPSCNYTGTATGYNTSILSVTVTTGTGTISFAFQGLSAGMTSATLTVMGQVNACDFTQPVSITVTGNSGQTGTPITVPALPGGGYAPQFYDSSFPPGCILNATTTNPYPGVATISPTSLQNANEFESFTINGVSPGTDNITITTTVTGCSNAGTSNTVLDVTVEGPPGPLEIPGGGGASQITLSGAMVSTSYSQTLPVSGGVAPYTWSLIGGALPPGLTLSSTGVLSGVPAQAGSFSFTAKVTDSSGAAATSIFTISVTTPALTITTAPPLPGGIVNAPYPPAVVSASGGNPPYTFQANGLPAGLTLSNGAISGTPTAAGNPMVTLTVTDSGSPAATASSQFPITINPARTDLLLSQTTISFTLTNGATGLPPAARVAVESTTPTQPIEYNVSTPAVPWLTVTGGTTTPGAAGLFANTPGGINFALNSQALALTSTTQTSVTVTCYSGACDGNTQTVIVKVSVANAAPQLSVGSGPLTFSVASVNAQPVSQTLGLENAGGGTITVNSVKAANSYISVSGAPATLAAGSPSLLTVTVNPSGLAAGFYQSSIAISTSAGAATVPVTVLVSQNPTMTLNPSGALLQATSGALPGNPNGSFEVTINGGSINWTATLLPGANWITLDTTSGVSTPANPGTIKYTINASAASLAPQSYYAAIQVASGGAADTPLTYIVVLNVNPATALPVPSPAPAGLLFIYSGSTPAAQSITVYTSSVTAQTYQVATDSAWLLSNRTVGQSSSASPGVDSITVNPGGLSAGVYTGQVSYSMAGAGVRSVNATLIVEAGLSSYSARSGESPRATGCTPAHLVPTQTGLVNSFLQPVAWPVPLTVLLVNDCGQPVTNGQVVATFSNGDPPLILTPTDTVSGNYTATWTPGNAAQQVVITATATAAGFPAASAVISGQVTPNIAPLLNPNGTINAFAIAAEPGVPLAPGTVVQIYGSNLAAQTTLADTIPLPTSLSQTSVIIGGIVAPLYLVSPGQINAQVPFELAAGSPYQVLVNANQALSTPETVQLTGDSPGVAQFPAGQVIAQHLDFSFVTETSPAKPGEIIMIYVAGMGLTTQTVPSGTASPLATVLDPVTLTLGGAPVTNILYAGLTPTVVGLYQIDFQIPASAPNGDLQLVLTQTSGVVNSSIVPVHN